MTDATSENFLVAPAVGGRPRLLLPNEYAQDLTARLDALDAAAEELARTKRPANTLRSYASDWATWQEFASSSGLPLTAAVRSGVLRAYVDWLWNDQKRAFSTVDRKLTGLTVTSRQDHGVEIPKAVTKAARQYLRDLAREAAERKEPARGRGKAPALLLDSLRAIVAAAPRNLVGLRDRATVLLCFALAARRHEVAALMGRDVVLVPGEGLVVDVRVSKTHPRQVAVPYASDPAICPVRTWLEWKETVGIEPGTPAVRRMYRTSSATRAGLSPQSVSNIIAAAAAAAAQRAGIPYRFTGHSARRGLITVSAKAGKDRRAISRISGHVDGSSVLEGYIEAANRFGGHDNALKGVM